MHLSNSELIINPDGSIFHLHLRPGDLADTIITVGDQNRVEKVAKYFDKAYHNVRNREFYTITGRVGNKDVSVISSGIGTDNIDILINEVDALFNIDMDTREIIDNPKQLTFIRLGTSGSIRKEIEVDNLVCSAWGLGLDAMGQFYPEPSDQEFSLKEDFDKYLEKCALDLRCYAAEGDSNLIDILMPEARRGITVSCAGFYAPQGRSLRMPQRYPGFLELIRDYHFDAVDLGITNFEMETGGIYLLSRILGHRALSINTILANRESNTFSKDPAKAVDNMIQRFISRVEDI